MRPKPRSALRQAIRKGILAAWHNLVPMLLLQAAMAALVGIYYCWPAGSAALSRYADWQHQGGLIAAAFATALAGGALSEFSLVYFQNKGRWTLAHAEHMFFKLVMFFISGSAVYVFYGYQTIWFGEGTAWSILLPKIFVDQFIFSTFWAAPYQTFMTRLHANRYSTSKLWREVNWDLFTDRTLPIIVTGWMFWIPGVFLIYSMPSALQVPLFIFATAIWGILLPAVAKQETEAVLAEEEIALT